MFISTTKRYIFYGSCEMFITLSGVFLSGVGFSVFSLPNYLYLCSIENQVSNISRSSGSHHSGCESVSYLFIFGCAHIFGHVDEEIIIRETSQ